VESNELVMSRLRLPPCIPRTAGYLEDDVDSRSGEQSQ
jgi:hypothetical protein